MKSSHYVDEGVRLVRLQNIGEVDFIDSDRAFISQEHFAQLPGHDVLPGDLLVAGLGDEGHPVGRACTYPDWSQKGMVKADCFRLRLRQSKLIHRFAAYYLSSEAARAEIAFHIRGATRERINLHGLASVKVPVPPIVLQRFIVNHLDRKTAQIDALIAKKQQHIELLGEKRQALISQAVTKGLDPTATMKPSGISWLGDIPTHWNLEPLKHSITKIEQGWSPQCDTRPADEEEWGVLKVGCVNGTEFNPAEQKALPAELEPIPVYEVRSGDILMSRGNTRELVGSAALVRTTRRRLMICDLLYRFRARPKKVIAEFLVLALRSPYLRYQIEREATGTSSSMKKIGQETIREFTVCIPPVSEQNEILNQLKPSFEEIDRITELIDRQIYKLIEYRLALISAVVTGKLSVEREGRDG